MTGLTAVLMNDTRPNNHHGCSRVMDVITEKLAARGIAVIGSAPVGKPWDNNENFLEALRRADVVVINGEGTMHHGARKGAQMLQVVEHPDRGNTPVFLINTLYQDNPPFWRRYLRAMAGVSARDSRSAAEMSAVSGREVGFCHDLSLCGSDLTGDERRSGVLVGESVLREVSSGLAQLAENALGDRRIAIKWVEHPPARRLRLGARQMLEDAGLGRFFYTQPMLRRVPTVAEYAHELRRAELHVTGRFHGVCLSIATGTPFLAVRSNSWKIEALLEDTGLGTDRLVDLDALPRAARDPAFHRFSEQEAALVAKAVSEGQARSDALFDDIAKAAKG
ncbi:polysaccharide pyruvyl transferase family protein [Oceanibium sediminis]|uniref:polysaccharide pyruvyl transferase family protein n=1 Tax=Oceanibium sediminis TaxID=2026339 RepID=UPI000DD3EA0D|nr:polysaccharide pyruvyl transferase family protein [Oceanibium sediminis]